MLPSVVTSLLDALLYTALIIAVCCDLQRERDALTSLIPPQMSPNHSDNVDTSTASKTGYSA